MKTGPFVAVGLLGALELGVDGRSFGSKDFGGRKPKQVVEILLVHQGEPVAKDRIVDLLWGERLPSDPMRTLEAYVSGIRGRLHADPAIARTVLCSEPGAYRFALDSAGVDLWRFDGLAAQAAVLGAAEALPLREEALGLVRGDLLADEPYAEWTFALRELYRERHLEMLLDAAHDHLLAGQPKQALDQGEQAFHRRVEPTTSVNKNVTVPDGTATPTASQNHAHHAARPGPPRPPSVAARPPSADMRRVGGWRTYWRSTILGRPRGVGTELLPPNWRVSDQQIKRRGQFHHKHSRRNRSGR